MSADSIPEAPIEPPAAEPAEDTLDVPVEIEGVAAEAAPVDPSVARIAELEAAVAKAEQERKDTYDKFLRSAADLENHRRRSKRDMDDARAESKTRVLKEMLPVVDNLERALQHAEEGAKGSADQPAIIDGVRLVLRQFTNAFERCEVSAVVAEGQPFDPNLHEAISQQETDASPPGTVVQVLQRGYKLGERLLRPALVVVAKAPPAPAPTPEPEPAEATPSETPPEGETPG